MCSWIERFDTEIIEVLYKFIYGHLIEEHVRIETSTYKGFQPHESLGTAIKSPQSVLHTYGKC